MSEWWWSGMKLQVTVEYNTFQGDVNWGHIALKMSQNVAKSMTYMVSHLGCDFQPGSCLYKPIRAF